jgi:hypothetical protein
MPFIIDDRVRETATTTGTGPIALGGAPNTSYQPFSAVMSIGDTCWYAIVLPGTSWETGIGTYTAANTLTRTTVLRSSSAGAAVSFGAGSKDVFMALPASKGNVLNNTFPSGTLMLFQQTSAPIYWTKQVTHNDKALRVVSGTASSGGTNSFSTVNGATAAFVNGHQLTVTEMPSHSHATTNINGASAINNAGGSQGFAGGAGTANAVGGGASFTINSTGGDGQHSHTLNMAIQYVDLIIASKD